MNIDKKELLTLTIPYGKIQAFVDNGAYRFVREFDDVPEVEAVCYIKERLQDEIDKIEGRDEMKRLQEEKTEIERKMQRVSASNA
jgi:hypothetical protein